MGYYVTLNQLPICIQNPRLTGNILCSHETRELAELAAAKLKRMNPGTQIRVIKGECPIYTYDKGELATRKIA
jgi:hypothetical protein